MSVESCYAHLTVYVADGCEPGPLTDRVAVGADEVQRAGDPVGTGGRRRRRSLLTWRGPELAAEDVRVDVDAAIGALVRRLSPAREQLRALIADGAVDGARLGVYLATVRANPEFVVDPDTLRFLGHIGAQLWVDIYVHDEADGERGSAGHGADANG